MESEYKGADRVRREQEEARVRRNAAAFGVMSREQLEALEAWFEARYYVHLPAFDNSLDVQRALARDTARKVWLDIVREWKKQHGV